MAVFRIAAAAGILLAFAPAETLKVVRAAFGMADEARQIQVREIKGSAGELALAYCKANPEICLDAARQAAGAAPQPQGKPARP